MRLFGQLQGEQGDVWASRYFLVYVRVCVCVCECVHVLLHWFAARQNPGVQRCSHCLQGLQIFLEESQSPAP